MPTDAASQPHILVADDQADVLEALRLLLKGHGFDVDTVSSPAAALAALERRDYDAMLLDMNYTRDTTSGKEGLDLLLTLQTLEPNMPVVVMTAWGSIDNAVEAMRRGARDYIEKPWDNARLVSILTTQVELGRALRRTVRLETENRLLRRDHLPQMIAESPKMKPMLQLMERVGPSDANVLITGEHGTGKELVAQWLHASSPRSARSFIAVNMGGLSEGVFESELFGHVKGSFTDAKTDRVGRFELADGGTLFLDEIGTVPLSLQSKLLRVLQTGDVERVGSSKARHVDVRDRFGDERQSPAGGRPRAAFAKTCCSGSTRSRSICRRCATGARTFPRWRRISSGGTRRATARRSAGSTPARCSCCSAIRGRATSASSITRSSARCCSRRASRCAPATSGCGRRRAPRRASTSCRSRTSRSCSFRKRYRDTTAT